jgi:DNA repair exonuclease SbcCD ATPase subunit
MSDVYLSRLKLRGFRSYASETEVAFPAGPGMTVIVGPNGLGKSTLFDAIEWGVTGELRRLNGMEAKASEKRVALGCEPEVQLWFSDEAHISRNLSGSTIANAGTASIAEWLTADAWRGVSNIADCLQFTHFLGQSARQMFVHLDGKERWGLLEGPAGLQSLWKVELALGRKQTQLAFDRVERELAQTALQASENIELVKKLQTDLRAMRELARAGDALTPEEILERCSGVSDELANGFGRDALAVDAAAAADVQDLDGILQRQKIDIEAAARRLTTQRMQLSLWENLAEQYSVILAKLADLGPARDVAAEDLIGDEAEAAELAKHVLAREEEWRINVDKCTELQVQRDAVLAESERLRQLVILGERRLALEALSGTLALQADEQDRLVTASREALALLEFRRDRYAEAAERSTLLAGLTAQAEALLDENRSRQDARVELMFLPQTEHQLLAELTAIRKTLAEQETEASALRSRKEAAVAVSNAIAAGVAQIAAALRKDDCVCPVCRSTFTVTGQLKDLAEQQARESDQQLVGLEAEILRQDERMRIGRQQMDALTGQLDHLQENRLALSATITAADERENHLRSYALLAGLALDAFLPALLAATAQIDEEIRSLASALRSAPDEATIKAEIQRLTTLRRETDTKYDECSAACAALDGELGLLRSWPYTGKTADELMVVSATLNLALVEAQQAGIFAQANRQVALATAAASIERVSAKRSQLAQIDNQRELLDVAVNQLVSRWNDQGYEHRPLPEAVRGLDADLQNKQLSLRRVEQEHETIVQGRRHYLAHSELQRIEGDLEAQCSRHEVTDAGVLLVSLSQARDHAIRQQSLLSSVQDKRKNLLARIKEKATNIRNAVSAPLNANIEKFCAALMSDRNHHVSLNAIANATSAQALLSFQLGDEREGAKNPLLYMSEGQLAAVGLCLLFGASATYPWSRWKGLLMDDPLHHNDSIHAAAFIDVARNLIRHQGYQIIVSTHDMEQAGYFLRKCRNAGIPARYWHLYGRKEDGTAMVQSA